MTKFLGFKQTLLATSALGFMLLSVISHAEIAQAKIANGSNTTISQAPWQVALATLSVNANGSSYSRFCAGTLISNQWIVSAAHCFEDASHSVNAHAIVGQQNLSANVPLSSFYKIASFVKRTDYNNVNFNNDIILIKLAEPIDLNNCNGCTPAKWSNNDSDSNINTNVFVAGWGATTTSSAATTLQSTTLNIVNCVSNKTGASYTVGGQALSSNTICAQSSATPPSDTCPGDSGSGLIGKYSTSPTLVGITSFSITGNGAVPTCNNSTEFPGGYTKVSNYCQWITEKTGINNNCVASNQVNVNNTQVENATQNTSSTSTVTSSGSGGGGGSIGGVSILTLMLSALWMHRKRAKAC